MMDIFEHPTAALLMQLVACMASLYAVILGVITIKNLPKSRDVARAASVLIVLVSAMYIATSGITIAQGCQPDSMPILQVIDCLKVLIYILVLKLFVRPCYVEEQQCGMYRRCRELS